MRSESAPAVRFGSRIRGDVLGCWLCLFCMGETLGGTRGGLQLAYGAQHGLNNRGSMLMSAWVI